MQAITKEEVKAALNGVQAVAECIRQLGEVPSGELYAQLMGSLDLRSFESIIGLLKRANLVTERGHKLTWIGPKLETAAAA